MDTVDNVNEAQPTEETTIGIGVDQDGLNEMWQSFYTQNLNILENVYKQVGEGLLREMADQIPDFDPDGEHKELFEASVRKNVPDDAEPYIMGIINGGLVAFREIGKRLDLDISAISQILQDLNPNAGKTKEEALNESNQL